MEIIRETAVERTEAISGIPSLLFIITYLMTQCHLYCRNSLTGRPTTTPAPPPVRLSAQYPLIAAAEVGPPTREPLRSLDRPDLVLSNKVRAPPKRNSRPPDMSRLSVAKLRAALDAHFPQQIRKADKRLRNGGGH
jgi:hypothetical protein